MDESYEFPIHDRQFEGNEKENTRGGGNNTNSYYGLYSETLRSLTTTISKDQEDYLQGDYKVSEGVYPVIYVPFFFIFH